MGDDAMQSPHDEGYLLGCATFEPAPWRARAASVVLLHGGAQAAVEGVAPHVANAAGVLLLNAGDTASGLAGRGDVLQLGAAFAAALARSEGVDPGRPFAHPWLRLPPDAFLRLRQLACGAPDVPGVEGWLRRLLQSAGPEWRKRPVPAAEAFGQRGRFDLAQALCGWLDRHWRRNVSLAELAGVFGLTSFHLLRVFRRETGLTLHQYALQLRLRRSLLELEDSPPRLAELAAGAGFSSHAHFSSAFRAAWGLTPRQYAGCNELPRARSPRL
jgi:AraC-like DNA-binding protein